MASRRQKNIPLIYNPKNVPMVKQEATKTTSVLYATNTFKPKKLIGKKDNTEFVRINENDIVIEVTKLNKEYSVEVYKVLQIKQNRILVQLIEQAEEMQALIDTAKARLLV